MPDDPSIADFLKPKTQGEEPSISAFLGKLSPAAPPPSEDAQLKALPAPGVLDTIKGVLTGDVRTGDTGLGRLLGISQEKIAPGRSNSADLPLVKLEAAVPPEVKDDSTVVKVVKGGARGVAKIASGFTTGEGIAIQAATGGLGTFSKIGAGLLPRLVSGGFSADMIHGAYQQIPEAKAAMDAGDYGRAAEAISTAGASLLMGGIAAKHALHGAPVAPGAAERLPTPDEADAATTAKAQAQVQQILTQTAPPPEPSPTPEGRASSPSAVPRSAEPEPLIADMFGGPKESPAVTAPAPDTLPVDFFAGQEEEPPVVERPHQAPPEVRPADFFVQDEKPSQETAQAATLPSPETTAPLRGSTARVKTARGTKVDTAYKLVPAEDLIASHDTALNENPDYPAELQPRDRTRAASEAQINEIAGKLDPEELGASYKAGEGAPIVGADNVVESGNGRTIALKRLYERGHKNGESYREFLRENAESFGFRPEDVDAIKNPILVRERQGEIDRPQFAREANEHSVAAMSASEQARSDSTHMTGDLMKTFAPAEDGDLHTAANRDFVRGFMDQAISPAERSRYMTSDGSLSQEGVARVRNAVFHRAYGDTGVIEKMAESTDSNIRNITNGMLQAAPRFASLAEGIEKGDVHAHDFAPDVAAAAAKLSALRDQGTTIDDYLAQDKLFGEDLTPETRTILEKLHEYRRSPKKIGAFLQNVTDQVEGLGSPKQEGIFGPAEVPSKSALLAAAIHDTNVEFGEKANTGIPAGSGPSLFAEARPGTDPSIGGERESAQTPEAGKSGGTGRFGSERGSLDVGEIAAALHDAFGPEGPEINYSGLGAVNNRFVRNLSQLEKASPAAHAKAVEAASAKGQVKVLMRSAIPQIERELGDLPFSDFRRALVESRLQGIRGRWSDLASQVARKNPDQLGKALDNGLMGVLQQIEGKRGIPADVTDTAIALLGQAKRKQIEPAVLGKFLSDTFHDAADSTARTMSQEEFDSILRHPKFQRGRAAYQELLERPIAESHMQNEGVFSNALGPADSYYPLVPLEEEPAKPILSRSPTYQKPRNIANQMATGLAKEYDTTPAALENRLTRAFRANSKAALIQSVIDHGLLLPLPPGEHAGDTIEIGGTAYAAKTIELNEPYQTLRNGKVQNVEAKVGVVPKWLADELEPILKRRDIRISSGRKLLNAVNKVALAGPTDAVFHATNLLGTMVANTPFLGESVMAKTVGNLPFSKMFTAVVKLATTDPESAESVRDLGEMAKLGLVPDKFGSVTYAKRFADAYGAHRELYTLGPLLYGPRGMDVRARLVMWRVAKQLDPGVSPVERAKFVNQLGNYVQGLQGGIERSLKETGLAPFYTAGSTMYRNGVNAVLGRGPLNRGSNRVAQQLSGGLIGLAATQVLAHRALNGNWPWEDKRSKLGKIPLPNSLRHSELGNMLFGKGNDTGYVSLAFFNPIAMRGARALGLPGAYDEGQLGGNGQQRIEAALRDMGNAAISPVTTGPLVKAGTILATGDEPYAVSSNPFQLMSATDKRKHGVAMLAERGKEAMLAQNPFVGSLANATGLGHRYDPDSVHGDRWLKMASAIAFPRLFAQANIPRQASSARTTRAKIEAQNRRDGSR